MKQKVIAWDQQLAFMAEKCKLKGSARANQKRINVNRSKAEAIIKVNFS